MNLQEIRLKYPQYATVSDEKLATALHQKYYSHVPFEIFAERVGYSAANPAEGRGTLQLGPMDTGIPISEGATRFLEGAGKAFVDTGRGARQLLGIGDQETLQDEIDESRRLDTPLMDTGAGLAGNIMGHVAPILAVPAGAAAKGAGLVAKRAGMAGVGGAIAGSTLADAALVGAGSAALMPTSGDEDRTANASTGAALGAAGQAGVKIISTALRPVKSELAPYLQSLAEKAQQYGYKLTPAQKTGSEALKNVDAALENLPLTAGKQAALGEHNRKLTNKLILNQLGAEGDEITPPVIEQLKRQIGDEFGDLAKGRNIKLDRDFVVELRDAANEAAKLAPSLRSGKAKRVIMDWLGDASKGRVIPGDVYQANRSELGRLATSTTAPGVSRAYKIVQKSLDNAARRSLPDDEVKAWDTARSRWQLLKAVEKAVTDEGDVSAARLSNEIERNIRGKGGNYGEAREVARIGKVFNKSRPDSGTGMRQTTMNLLQYGVPAAGAAAGGMYGGPEAGIGAGVALLSPRLAQAAMMSGAGQRYLTQGIAPYRNKVMAELLRNASVGGPVAALKAGEVSQ